MKRRAILALALAVAGLNSSDALSRSSSAALSASASSKQTTGWFSRLFRFQTSRDGEDEEDDPLADSTLKAAAAVLKAEKAKDAATKREMANKLEDAAKAAEMSAHSHDNLKMDGLSAADDQALKVKQADEQAAEAARADERRATRELEGALKDEEDIKKAEQTIEDLESGTIKAPKCDIQKVGFLKMALNPDEVLDSVDVIGQIQGDSFAFFYPSTHKLRTSFAIATITLPIVNVPDSQRCFEFKSFGHAEVVCAETEVARNAWIDSLTEAWMCNVKGVRGMLPPTKQEAEKEAEVLADKQKAEADQKPVEKPGKKAAVDIKVGTDENGNVYVEENGKRKTLGSEKATDTKKEEATSSSGSAPGDKNEVEDSD